MGKRAPRNRQLQKAYEWLCRGGDIVQVIIPARIDIQTGMRRPAEKAEIYRDEIGIYRQIYGNRLIEIVD